MQEKLYRNSNKKLFYLQNFFTDAVNCEMSIYNILGRLSWFDPASSFQDDVCAFCNSCNSGTIWRLSPKQRPCMLDRLLLFTS